eukprot:TRINITY_DN2897_c0_g1_i1.p1 TRINITY_DN2897_c0_g1~~TRINITY_DN2897_c0_g1_i1.p1  ORF type:complete len:411 (+),score=67.66 TRINITY_DN2897_c0_g1_i1:156-1388(+)
MLFPNAFPVPFELHIAILKLTAAARASITEVDDTHLGRIQLLLNRFGLENAVAVLSRLTQKAKTIQDARDLNGRRGIVAFPPWLMGELKKEVDAMIQLPSESSANSANGAPGAMQRSKMAEIWSAVDTLDRLSWLPEQSKTLFKEILASAAPKTNSPLEISEKHLTLVERVLHEYGGEAVDSMLRRVLDVVSSMKSIDSFSRTVIANMDRSQPKHNAELREHLESLRTVRNVVDSYGGGLGHWDIAHGQQQQHHSRSPPSPRQGFALNMQQQQPPNNAQYWYQSDPPAATRRSSATSSIGSAPGTPLSSLDWSSDGDDSSSCERDDAVFYLPETLRGDILDEMPAQLSHGFLHARLGNGTAASISARHVPVVSHASLAASGYHPRLSKSMTAFSTDDLSSLMGRLRPLDT